MKLILEFVMILDDELVIIIDDVLEILKIILSAFAHYALYWPVNMRNLVNPFID